jgi:hypothetical protein
MATNLTLDREIALLQLEAKVEGLQHKHKQIKIEKMMIQKRVSDLDDALAGVEQSITDAQLELNNEKEKGGE